MLTPFSVTVEKIRGNHYDLGRSQGKQLLANPRFRANTQMLQSKHPRKINLEEAKAVFLQFAPGLWDELQGLADGLSLSLDEVVRDFGGYNAPLPEMGCSSLITPHYYARNYDFHHRLYDARLVLTQPDFAYASIGFSQQWIGRLDGMNEKGFVVGLHFVNQLKGHDGLLATTICRILLDHCANVPEAIDMLKQLPHSHAYNYSLMDSSGASSVVEASPVAVHVRTEDAGACTNHFSTPTLLALNRARISPSQGRFAYLQKLFQENLSPEEAFHRLNATHSPVFHNDYHQFFGTLHTVVYMPRELHLLVGIGGDVPVTSISLPSWLQGEATIQELSGMLDV